MNCQEVTPLTHAYSDGELDLVRSLEIERHLTGCPSCSAVYDNTRALKTALKSSDLYFTAPTALRRQVRRSVLPQTNPPPLALSPSAGARETLQSRPAWFNWWQLLRLGLPAMAAVVIALLLVPALIGQSNTDRLAQEVASAHVRSLMVDHKTDVASSDQHTVKPWFQGKIDFTPPVTDLAEQGFPLVGGRLDYLDGHPVVALVYQRHQHLINVFIWPSSSNSGSVEKALVLRGYNLVHWTASGMNFWAVSDLNQAELSTLARLIQASSTHAAM